jgi:adenylate cyclase
MNVNWRNDNYNNNNNKYPYQTILDLYESNISPDVIASQLDISKDDVIETLKSSQLDQQNKEKSIIIASSSPKQEMINSISDFDVENSLQDIQKRIWSNLKTKSISNINIKDTQKLLEKIVNTDISLVILYADLVSSTKLSMNLPLKRLAPIIQAFTQEMSLIVDAYGGYVFKFVGDGILSFFFVAEKDDLNLPCSKAIDCGRSMIEVIKEGMNAILDEYGYPELSIRIGIDVGKNAVVKYNVITNSNAVISETFGKNNFEMDNNNQKNNDSKTIAQKNPLFDILGYTINTASKMTQYAKPNQIIIGSAVFNNLDKNKKRNFSKIHIDSESWNYIDNSNGNVYGLYGN